MGSEVVERAKEFAIKRHGNQRYGKYPYEHHLVSVVSLLNSFEFDDEVVAAGWLHDVVEDTDVTMEELIETFGREIGSIVHAVTDGSGKNREERKTSVYAKIIERGRPAVAVKVADRICNLFESIHEGDKNLIKMYLKERFAFDSIYLSSHEVDGLWNFLRILYNLAERK